MPRVRFSSKTNSTTFTTCCGVAICDDQSKCPVCGEVIPLPSRGRFEMAMLDWYGVEGLRKLRAGYIKKEIIEKALTTEEKSIP